MTRRAEQTAAAFGDTGDRDYQADFGAIVAPKLTASASVKAPKVGPVLAPPAPKPTSSPAIKVAGMAPPTAEQQATATALYAAAVQGKASGALRQNVSKSTPAPVAKAATTAAASAIKANASALAKVAPKALIAPVGKPTAAATLKLAPPSPKPTSSAAPKSGGAPTTALQGNFIDASSTPMALPTVKNPLTGAQQAANAKAIAQRTVDDQARKTASDNAAYTAQRLKEKREHDAFVLRMQTEDSPEAKAWRDREKYISSARTDLGLLPAGAAVIAAGAAIIATGGAAAGLIAAPSLATVAGAAVAADRALAAAEKAKLVGKGVSESAGKVRQAAAVATNIIDTTQQLAEQGVPGAIEGVKIIARTAAERVLSGALPGVPQALTPAGAAAYDDYASPALKDALASAAPVAGGYSAGAAALASRARRDVTGVPVKPALVRPIVEWFVSSAGKVTQGAVTVGSGWRVYSDGKVVKQ